MEIGDSPVWGEAMSRAAEVWMHLRCIRRRLAGIWFDLRGIARALFLSR